MYNIPECEIQIMFCNGLSNWNYCFSVFFFLRQLEAFRYSVYLILFFGFFLTKFELELWIEINSIPNSEAKTVFWNGLSNWVYSLSVVMWRDLNLDLSIYNLQIDAWTAKFETFSALFLITSGLQLSETVTN